MPGTVSTSSNASGRWIEADPAVFQKNFNRRSFELRHGLASHPLLQLPKLAALAERTLASRPADLHYDMGPVKIDERWDKPADLAFSALEAFDRIENAGAWFILFRAEKDPEYRDLLDHGLGEIKSMIGGNIDSKIMKEEIIVFVTSPNRITPYHIDCECNFLLQVRGTKTVHVFDGTDKDIVSDEEVERYWTLGEKQPPYRKHLQDRATSYNFAPGTGAHIPVNHPHWVQNNDNVSISLSVNFQFKHRYRADIYRTNHYLRRLGLQPNAPGKNPVVDYTKAMMMGTARSLVRLARPGQRETSGAT
jgi:hypothetical protein